MKDLQGGVATMGVIYHRFILYPAASSLKVVLSTDAPREAAAGLVFFSTDRSVRSRLLDATLEEPSGGAVSGLSA